MHALYIRVNVFIELAKKGECHMIIFVLRTAPHCASQSVYILWYI